ncbi:MAG: 30S ribosomal protein S17e [Nanoarchaeota archaeon]|nr:30S ribosomal protein S17e [Nanoarchaeota archaeon]
MGRIKNIPVKTLGDDLVRHYQVKFGTNFEKNKKSLANIQPIKSKRVRNQVAGHITNKMKKLAKV